MAAALCPLMEWNRREKRTNTSAGNTVKKYEFSDNNVTSIYNNFHFEIVKYKRLNIHLENMSFSETSAVFIGLVTSTGVAGGV